MSYGFPRREPCNAVFYVGETSQIDLYPTQFQPFPRGREKQQRQNHELPTAPDAKLPLHRVSHSAAAAEELCSAADLRAARAVQAETDGAACCETYQKQE